MFFTEVTTKLCCFWVYNTYGFVYQYLRICLLKPTDLFTNSYVFVYLDVDKLLMINTSEIF